jgi:hypothetical protein
MNAYSIDHFVQTSTPKDGGRSMERSSRQLYSFIDDLISSYGHEDRDGMDLSVNNLSDHIKEKFVARLLEEDDRDLYSIYENKKYDDIVIALLNMLKNDCLDTRNDFAESVRNNMVAYYEPKMQQLIDEQIPGYLAGRREFLGEAA